MNQNDMAQGPAVVLFNNIRSEIKKVASATSATIVAVKNTEANAVENRGEVMANLTLAFRHLEDASMRLGKAIQARDGGVSVYDKATTVGA